MHRIRAGVPVGGSDMSTLFARIAVVGSIEAVLLILFERTSANKAQTDTLAIVLLPLLATAVVEQIARRYRVGLNRCIRLVGMTPTQLVFLLTAWTMNAAFVSVVFHVPEVMHDAFAGLVATVMTITAPTYLGRNLWPIRCISAIPAFAFISGVSFAVNSRLHIQSVFVAFALIGIGLFVAYSGIERLFTPTTMPPLPPASVSMKARRLFRGVCFGGVIVISGPLLRGIALPPLLLLFAAVMIAVAVDFLVRQVVFFSERI